MIHTHTRDFERWVKKENIQKFDSCIYLREWVKANLSSLMLLNGCDIFFSFFFFNKGGKSEKIYLYDVRKKLSLTTV